MPLLAWFGDGDPLLWSCQPPLVSTMQAEFHALVVAGEYATLGITSPPHYVDAKNVAGTLPLPHART